MPNSILQWHVEIVMSHKMSICVLQFFVTQTVSQAWECTFNFSKHVNEKSLKYQLKVLAWLKN